MPTNPSNPDQKNQKDKSPWRALLQGLWLLVKTPFRWINEKIWVWDRAFISFQKNIFNYLAYHSFRSRSLIFSRPVLAIFLIIFFILYVIFFFRELFIDIFPNGIIAKAPFFLSFGHATLALGLLAFSGLAFFLLVPQPFSRLANLISSAWFLLLLLLVFSLALYNPPFADVILPDVIEDASRKITILTWAVGGLLGLLMVAQRLDVMNRQADAAQRQHEAEQFKQASELLAHKNMVARLGGITMLGTLARTRPKESYIRIVSLLAHFIRERSIEDDESPVKALIEWRQAKGTSDEEKKWQKFKELKKLAAPVDLTTAVRVVTRDLTEKQKQAIQKEIIGGRPWLDLEGCWLNQVNLKGAWLKNACFEGAFLHHAGFTDAFLPQANFSRAYLYDAHLKHTYLGETVFNDANVAKADFEGTKKMTKHQLSKSLCFSDESHSTDIKPINLPDGVNLPAGKMTEKRYWDSVAGHWNAHGVIRINPDANKKKT